VVPANTARLNGVSAIGMVVDANRTSSSILVLTKSDLVTRETVEDDIIKRVLGTAGWSSSRPIQFVINTLLLRLTSMDLLASCDYMQRSL
jgi:hypothetical protein